MPDTLAHQRRQQSESVLQAQQLQFDAQSSAWNVTFAEAQYPLRSNHDVANRCLAVLLVALKAEGLEPAILRSLRHDYQVDSHVTSNERIFLDDATSDDSLKSQFLWYYESAWALLWALGYVDSMGEVNRYADAAHAVLCMRERSYKDFIADVTLREHNIILQQLDLLYRYDLINLHYQHHNLHSSAFDEGVVFERYYALLWLCDAEKRDWDTLATSL